MNREQWAVHPDPTAAALMAKDYRDLMMWMIDNPRGQAFYPVSNYPQLAQIFSFRNEVLADIDDMETAFNKTKEAYTAGDAEAFSQSMQLFEREVRRLADVMEEKRAQLNPPDPKQSILV
ncbi:MAG: hypothetical protein R3C11_09005 [Planctomycetaceae bacterium]